MLKETDKTYPQDNKQFDVVISNPPYSVSAFKGLMDGEKSKNGFDLFDRLTDQSSEIECLFIERTKQLLKDGGIAGIILPSSILSNSGIYTQAREIILKYFEVLAIAEMGSNTFMATGTNTVTLFLRRRNNADAPNIEEAIKKCFINLQDVTINGIEKPVSKYIFHVWESISYNDYKTLLQKEPNEKIKQHEIYKEYKKKVKAKNEQEFWVSVLALEQEKLLYFIIAHPQKLVLIKTGSKNEEKRFLGYEFSNRRGSEGIHPMQRSKSIDECTQLYDANTYNNPEKASTYIYKAFNNEFDLEIPENLKQNVSYQNLTDLLTFDRASFERNILLAVKKKVKIKSKYEIVRIGQIVETQYGYTDKATSNGKVRYLRITDLNDNGTIKLDNQAVFINPDNEVEKQFLLKNNDIVIARSGSVGKSAIYNSDKYEEMVFASYLIRLIANTEKILPQYLFNFTKTKIYWDQVKAFSIAVTQPNLNAEKIKEFQIPLPPISIQQKIVSEIETLVKQEQHKIESIINLRAQIKNIYLNSKNQFNRVVLSKEIQIIGGGTPKTNISEYWNGNIPWLSINDFKGEKKYVYDTERKITKLGLDKSSTKLLNEGDLIISARGTVGELAMLNIPMAFNQSCYGIKGNSNLDNEYLFYCLKFEIQQFRENVYGAIFDTITKRTFDSIKIPLPPISEQKKIVSEIEKIENKITEFEELINTIPKQKEAVLKKYLE